MPDNAEFLGVSDEEISGANFFGKPLLSWDKKTLAAAVCYYAKRCDQAERTRALVTADEIKRHARMIYARH